MRIKIIIVSFTILLISLTSGFAENDSLAFKNSIISKIVYPEFAMKDKLNTDVWVKFSVSESGKVIVDQINSVDVLFLDYVKTELQKIMIEKESELVGKTFYYKFTFRYQAE